MVATMKMLRKCLLVRDRPGNHPILLGKTYVTNSNWGRRRRRRRRRRRIINEVHPYLRA
jgi:hypothetical protein